MRPAVAGGMYQRRPALKLVRGMASNVGEQNFDQDIGLLEGVAGIGTVELPRLVEELFGYFGFIQ